MLIIEGSDCLGKTTFVNTLLEIAAKRLEYPTFYSHMSRPNGAFDFFKHYKDMMTTFAIQDRFHLGGIVWHEGKITEASLSIIEGWLQSIGSITVVLHASDEGWYRKRIKKDQRGNMLSVDTMCQANKQYTQMVIGSYELSPRVDLSWDLRKTSDLYEYPNPLFPDYAFAEAVIEAWFNRLDLL